MSATHSVLTRWTALLACGCALACGEEQLTAGFEEPLRVESGQFIEGALPGAFPVSGQQAATPSAGAPSGVSLVKAGQRVRASGTATGDAASVGIRFADLGSGYWVRPLSVPDLESTEGGFTWDLNIDFATDLTAGLHTLLLAGIGEDGQAGTQRAVEVCVQPTIPDRLSTTSVLLRGNRCDPKQQPPALVVSLGWNTAVDLDLQVVTPSGQRLDAKRPTNAVLGSDGEIDGSVQGTGRIDADSNADCVLDGLNRENLVFDQTPAPGRYYVYVDLYDACGQRSVHFDVSLHQGGPAAEPDTFVQRKTFSRAGQLLALSASGGSNGLFVTEFVVH
jgi:hypothetical protein